MFSPGGGGGGCDCVHPGFVTRCLSRRVPVSIHGGATVTILGGVTVCPSRGCNWVLIQEGVTMCPSTGV